MDPYARKKQENVAGYVIGMWHVEDLMRAHGLDLKAVEENLVAPLEGDDAARDAMRNWYANVLERMREEGLEQRGHLAEVEEVMYELEFLHRSLLEVYDDADYEQLYKAVEADIAALQAAANEYAEGPVATCFTAVYGVMVLRASQRTISGDTLAAEKRMRSLLEHLSTHYRSMRKLPGVSMN